MFVGRSFTFPVKFFSNLKTVDWLVIFTFKARSVPLGNKLINPTRDYKSDAHFRKAHYVKLNVAKTKTEQKNNKINEYGYLPTSEIFVLEKDVFGSLLTKLEKLALF